MFSAYTPRVKSVGIGTGVGLKWVRVAQLGAWSLK